MNNKMQIYSRVLTKTQTCRSTSIYIKNISFKIRKRENWSEHRMCSSWICLGWAWNLQFFRSVILPWRETFLSLRALRSRWPLFLNWHLSVRLQVLLSLLELTSHYLEMHLMLHFLSAEMSQTPSFFASPYGCQQPWLLWSVPWETKLGCAE